MQGNPNESYEARGRDAMEGPRRLGDPITKVRALPLPSLLLNRIYSQYPDPSPPMVEIELPSGGKRMEPNPNDPDYLERLERHRLQVARKVLDVVLLRGLEVLSIPPHVPPLEESGWVEEISYLTGAEVPPSGPGRKLAWLEAFIFLGAEDYRTVQTECLLLSGVPLEEAVMAAEDRFQRPGGGD